MTRGWRLWHHAAVAAAAIALVGAAAPHAEGQARQGGREKLVVLGPEGEIVDQVRYLRKTWRHNNAVSVVKVTGWPKCERSGESDTTYCWVRVRHQSFVSIEWLRGGPVDSFILHYWHKLEESPVRMADGDRVLVFLAPTVQGPQAYSATVIMPPTQENIDAVRQAVFEIVNSNAGD